MANGWPYPFVVYALSLLWEFEALHSRCWELFR